MNAHRLIESLQRFPSVLRAQVDGLADEDARWKPADGAWSILEILMHLADEEVEDFRTRVKMTLGDPDQPWPGIDPEGWAIERRYNEGELSEALHRFITERQKSVAWLTGLEDPDWSRAYRHPRLGPIRAGDVFVSWAAHDALHLRQIAKRLYQMTRRDGQPFTTDYAGPWTG
jgi:hypothetical protein